MRPFLILILSLFCISGCAKHKTSDIFAMDTIITLDVYGKNTDLALSEMKAEIQRLDKVFSPNSDTLIDDEVQYIIHTAENVSNLTDGAFNIYLGDVMRLWGFRDKNYRVPESAEIAQAISRRALDFGGIAKGYAGDCLKKIAEKHSIKSAILSLGGNVTVIGTRPDKKPWRVAITNPDDTTDYVGHIEVTDKSVVTSGSYQRYFEENGKIYHHIIDPKTGYPADSGIASATVISPDCTLADALSTAAFVLGTEKVLKLYDARIFDFEAVLIETNGKIITTNNANFHRKD